MIHIDWSYTDNEREKARSNYREYLRIKDFATTDIIDRGYAYVTKKVIVKDGCCLTDDQKALIADEGNLCFGYKRLGDGVYKIYTD